jgi:ABC-type amino acid transport system permease subunit
VDLALPIGLVDTQEMTTDAAALAVIVALMVGYYFARWRRAETSLKVNKTLADAAGKTAWKARGVMLLVGAVLWAVIDAWLRGVGR